MGLKDNYRYWRITNGIHDKGSGSVKKTLLFQSKVFLVCMLVFVFIIIGIMCGIALGIVNTTQGLTANDLRFKNLSTIFLDKDGNEAGKIFNGQNRTAVSLNDISKYLPEAFVAIEDERFYQHRGVDVKRTIGAVINYIIPGKKQYGGSTITQQLIKNVTRDDDISKSRKIREIWRALMLETKLSKDQILELYLNTVYFNKSAYGVEAASNTYFDKYSKDLTLAESAIIAGITQNPSKYDPIKNFDASKQRQETVLAKMKDVGYIDEEQYEQAIKEKIILKNGIIKKEAKQSYFIDAVCKDIIRDLQEKKNISKAAAQKMLFSDGLKVYTTMDAKVQEALDEAFADNSKVYKRFNGNSVKPQGAMIIIEYRTGGILGIAGGRGEKTGVMTFDIATDGIRQSGSSIKPLSVYGPALDAGLITAATVIDDSPVSMKLPDGKWWSPNNDNNRFGGLTTIRKGLQNSTNVVAVKTWQKLGAEASYDFIRNIGITTLTNVDKNSPAALALGGQTRGVSPIEMAAAYGAIANGGYYIKPITYTRVEDRNGKVILEKRPDAKKVMDERAAYILTNMLKDVVSYGTGKSAQLSDAVAAGKTGTTSENMDRWFVGYTPYYVGATWFGYDPEKRTIPGNTNYAAKLWQMVMEKAHRGLEKKDFLEPAGIIRQEICTESGQLATKACRRDSSKTKVEMFIKGTEPTDYCTFHK